MKSLDIVNDLIEFNSRNCITFNNKIAQDLIKVKQDLEVLEILKNKSVNISELKLVAYVFPTIEEKEILKRYNNSFASGTKSKLTFKQYQKIREWMEEQ